ncbi:MAG: transcriptional regulator [Nitrospinae bacterium CG11_big_fil_rev_8_21_14_0_20_56_8]|nr:MAG: transcriptional regulator [Nitrospinae bacterium CG11_big_fil_rev_8_21_14_0_20_56_8]
MNFPVKWIYDEKGKPESVVLSKEDYARLLRCKEDLEDIRALKQYEASREEGFPAAVVKRLVDGGNPIRVYREFRGLTQLKLSQRVGVKPSYITQLESGKRKGTVQVLKKIAAALDLDLDDLV